MQGKTPSNSRTEYLTVWGRFQLKDFLFGSHGGNCGSSVWCVRLAQLSLRALAFFLPVCTATKQTISQNLQGDLGHCKSETDPSSADKTLLEEMMKVEKKLRETVKKYNPTLVDTENLQQAGWDGQVVWHPELLQRLSGGCRHPREGNPECCKGEEQKLFHLKSIVSSGLMKSRFRWCSQKTAAHAPPHRVHIRPLWTRGLVPCPYEGKRTGHCSTS